MEMLILTECLSLRYLKWGRSEVRKLRKSGRRAYIRIVPKGRNRKGFLIFVDKPKGYDAYGKEKMTILYRSSRLSAKNRVSHYERDVLDNV